MIKKVDVKMALTLIFAVFFVITIAVTQKGLEEQLGGVRLGAPFIDYEEEGNLKPTCLFAIYGMPDYIVGRGVAPAQPGMMPSMPGIPGMMPGMPSMPGMPGSPMMPGSPVGMGSAFGGQPTLPGVMAGVGGMAQMAGAPMARPGIPTIPGSPMAPGGLIPEEMGALPGFGPTMPGLGPGAGVGGATTGGVAPTFPRPEELPWAIPPFVMPEINEIYFVYRKRGAHLNFLMELGEDQGRNQLRVVAITVAGRRYDGAKTAKGDPFKSIKLGDDFQRVLLRYGQPEEIVYYNPFTLQIVNTPTRNMILRYHRSSNIEFTLLENKVVRIFIFLPRRVVFTR